MTVIDDDVSMMHLKLFVILPIILDYYGAKASPGTGKIEKDLSY